MLNIPYGKQDIDEEDIAAVVKVLKSDFITQGPVISQFEEEFAKRVGAKFAVAVSNGTTALHIAYLASGMTQGSKVWTTPNTFVATSNAALYIGAEVAFVDICPKTYNISIEDLKRKLVESKESGTLPDFVVPVHFSGLSCEMDQISLLAKEYGFKVIEDASHAYGASFNKNAVGSCEFSTAVTFSFHPVKIVTTGEGGIITTNDEKLYEKLKILRTHGITHDPSLMPSLKEGPWHYQQIVQGFNYRMTDIQAALGLSQLKKTEKFIRRRREIAEYYNEKLKHLPLLLPDSTRLQESSWHLYVIQLLKHDRLEIFNKLREQKIGVNVHYIPVNSQPYYRSLGHDPLHTPIALKYYQNCLSLPIFPTIQQYELDYVIETLSGLLT